MKKRKQFLYFLAMLSLILTLPSVVIPFHGTGRDLLSVPLSMRRRSCQEKRHQAKHDSRKKNRRDRCGSIGSPGPSQRDRIFRFCFDALTGPVQAPALASSRIATGSNAEPREIVKVITPYSDILILAERQNARELLNSKLENREYFYRSCPV